MVVPSSLIRSKYPRVGFAQPDRARWWARRGRPAAVGGRARWRRRGASSSRRRSRWRACRRRRPGRPVRAVRRCGLRVRSGDPVGLAGESNVLPGREVVVDARLLSHAADGLADLAGFANDVEPVDADGTRAGSQQRRQHLDRRRLAGAVRPEEPGTVRLREPAGRRRERPASRRCRSVRGRRRRWRTQPRYSLRRRVRSPFTARLSNATDKYCRAPSPNDPAPDRFRFPQLWFRPTGVRAGAGTPESVRRSGHVRPYANPYKGESDTNCHGRYLRRDSCPPRS